MAVRSTVLHDGEFNCSGIENLSLCPIRKYTYTWMLEQSHPLSPPADPAGRSALLLLKIPEA